MRWTKQEADALARKWAQGDVLSVAERARRALRHLSLRELGIITGEDIYPVLAQVTEYMREKGLRRLEADLDPAIKEQMQCEDYCIELTATGCQSGQWSEAECEAHYRECLRRWCLSQPPVVPGDGQEDSRPANPQAGRGVISLPSSSPARSSPQVSGAPGTQETGKESTG